MPYVVTVFWLNYERDFERSRFPTFLRDKKSVFGSDSCCVAAIIEIGAIPMADKSMGKGRGRTDFAMR